MPAYTHLRTFIDAVKSGRTHITGCLDDFFASADRTGDPNWNDWMGTNWSGAAPAWLSDFLDRIGLTEAERDHVLRYPPSELERTRGAAAEAVGQGVSPTFRWGLYEGDGPRVTIQHGHRILFESPSNSLRLTRVNYGEVYVEDV